MSIMKPWEGATRVYIVNEDHSSPTPTSSIEYSAGEGIDITNHVISVTGIQTNSVSSVSSNFSGSQQYYNKYFTDNIVSTGLHFGNRVESLNGGILASSYINIDTQNNVDGKEYQIYGYHSEGGNESNFTLTNELINFFHSSAGAGWFGNNLVGLSDGSGKKTILTTDTLEINHYPDRYGNPECVETIPVSGIVSMYLNGPSAINISATLDSNTTAYQGFNISGFSARFDMDDWYSVYRGVNEIVPIIQNNMSDADITNEYGLQFIGGKRRWEDDPFGNYRIWERTEISNRMIRILSGNDEDSNETYIDSKSISLNDRGNEIQFFTDRMLWNNKTIMYTDLFNQFGV